MLNLGVAAQSLQFSPYHSNLITVGCAENFGIVGAGRQFIIEILPDKSLAVRNQFATKDGIIDCCWSEAKDSIIASATGDGLIKLWDTNSTPNSLPIGQLSGHSRECVTVDWNGLSTDLLLSGGWDGTVHVWSVSQGRSLMKINLPVLHPSSPPENNSIAKPILPMVYETRWSPTQSNIFAFASSDGSLRIVDLRAPAQAGKDNQIHLKAHEAECLSFDWNKYQDYSICTAGADQSIRIWDLRAPGVSSGILMGHTLAVKKARFSPYSATKLATCSYDMTVRTWNLAHGNQLERVDNSHTEFVLDVEWSLFEEGVLASCSWDRTVRIRMAS